MTTKFEVNTLWKKANEYSQIITEEEELEKQDITQEFYRELEKHITEGELISITINAKVRLGKSTAGLALAQHIFKLLQKHKIRKPEETFGIRNIARDQQEYSKIMKDPNIEYTVILIDEENELENTGENITAEKAHLADISNIQAGRYVHTIKCCPKGIQDPNSDIILEVVGTNKQEQITHARLYYRLYKGAEERMQLLGYVNIDVKPIVNNWHNNVKKHFYKPYKTKEDHKIIKEQSKKDWYVEYTIRKHEKMKLMSEEGISRPRMLEQANVILDTIEELRELAKIGNIVNSQVARNFVKSNVIKHKMLTSMLGEKQMTDEVMGVINLFRGHAIINRKIKRLEEEQTKPEKRLNEPEYQAQKEELKRAKGKMAEAIQKQIDEYNKALKVKQKYEKVNA